ncbi:MAG TPA: protein kinase [Pyrinomonadaceae bacterium]|jgi:serine/threonine protein kinase|nr:protein kinase [Pyrinomonadaceae bacterium]
MKPERWQQIDKLFHSLLGLEPDKRAALLAEACADDESLREQIEALVMAHDQAGGFIERPAIEVEARGVAADAETAESQRAISELSGESISHYRVIVPLGSGGMGQVYLAQDITLGRKVAVKVLPTDFTCDKDRVRRFQQEARAASALNHPNIITIHEIGQFDGRHFIATEFIDGETLRQRIAESQARVAGDKDTAPKPLKVHDILNIAIQTADALAAAHEAGVVHRDIKPENIMVRHRDGYVKVLDFGLAKLTDTASVDAEAPTRTQIKTSAGMVMGTVSYMSPEQVRGEQVDSRTDIWSLGVVLYEMVAGCNPFGRSTSSEVIALILEREPQPLVRYAREVPSELERIVSKALTKEKEERYQTAKDLLIDLRRLQHRLETDAEMERAATLGTASERRVRTDLTSAPVVSTNETAAPTFAATAHPTSSAEFLISEVKRHKGWTLVVLAALVTSVLGIMFGVYRFAGQRRSSSRSLEEMKVRRLTSNGKAADAAISPDGKYVIHVLDDGGKESLWLRQVETTSNVQILPPADVSYLNLTFSRDGNYIYYEAWDKKNPYTLYKIPVLGGAPRKLVDGLDGTVTFSPDGKLMAFIRGDPSSGENALLVANADGTGERTLAVRKEPATFDNWPNARNAPAWSPDGRSIAAPSGVGGDTPSESVIEVRVEDGAMKQITTRTWWRIDAVEWIRDGSGLIVNASEQSSSPFQIWHVSYPSGQAHRITNDANDYRGVSLTADSKVLATVQSEVLSSIWIVPQNDSRLATQITSGRSDGQDWVSVTSDGRIVYSSRASGNYDLWITDADGSNQKQLTAHGGNNDHPAVTRDGRYIVFISDRAGSPNLWRVDIDGSNPKQLTPGEAWYPDCSSDSQWVVYTSRPEGHLWKVPIDGGEPVPVTDYYVPGSVVSPDGKWIASLWHEDPSKIAIIPFAGGLPIKLLDIGWTRVHWTSDGRALAYVDRRDPSNISSQQVDGNSSRKLTDFKSDRIFSFAWSPDGKQLALARGTRTDDVILISSFEGPH